MSLDEKQLQVLTAISDGHTSEEKLVSTLDFPLELVRHYLESFKKHNLIEASKGSSYFGCNGMVFHDVWLTNAEKVAINDPDDLLPDDISSNNDFRGANINLAVDSPNSTNVNGNHNSIIGNQHNYSPEEQQNLIETVQHIESLIEHLKQTHPTATTSEQMQVATHAIAQIEQDTTLKQRAIRALKGGFLESIKSNLIGSFVAGAIEGWNNTDTNS